jgi:hypothetical protein
VKSARSTTRSHALPNLQFNDRARSIAVLSGQWEVCQHSDFTGRCVFLRYDVPDLAWYGLAGEISSVRPVYEYTDAEHGLMFVRDENGYIRYVDDEQYGYDTYNYGYGASTSIQVYHYGYSPEYRRYGYYDPRLGYDPYGFRLVWLFKTVLFLHALPPRTPASARPLWCAGCVGHPLYGLL